MQESDISEGNNKPLIDIGRILFELGKGARYKLIEVSHQGQLFDVCIAAMIQSQNDGTMCSYELSHLGDIEIEPVYDCKIYVYTKDAKVVGIIDGLLLSGGDAFVSHSTDSFTFGIENTLHVTGLMKNAIYQMIRQKVFGNAWYSSRALTQEGKGMYESIRKMEGISADFDWYFGSERWRLQYQDIYSDPE